MNITVYAINAVAIYLLLTFGFDLNGQLFGVKPFFMPSAINAVPIIVLTWVILLFHKPTKNLVEQSDFKSLRLRIIELGVLVFTVSVLFNIYVPQVKEFSDKWMSHFILTELSRFAHIIVFYFALYFATYSQILTHKLSGVSVHKALRMYFSALSQTVVIGGALLFLGLYTATYFYGQNQSPGMTKFKADWAQAEKAADKYELETVKKTCEPMPEETKNKYRENYYRGLQDKANPSDDINK